MTTAILIEEEIYSVQHAGFEESSWCQIEAKNKIKFNKIEEKKSGKKIHLSAVWKGILNCFKYST